jgi:hypothetical protein
VHFVQRAVAFFFVTNPASVTNPKTDARVASVTTELSWNSPIGSAPTVENSVPTVAAPSGASIESKR